MGYNNNKRKSCIIWVISIIEFPADNVNMHLNLQVDFNSSIGESNPLNKIFLRQYVFDNIGINESPKEKEKEANQKWEQKKLNLAITS